jgi:hypothetical protein
MGNEPLNRTKAKEANVDFGWNKAQDGTITVTITMTERNLLRNR